MMIANNASYKTFLSNYGAQNSKLQTSMARLSSGERMVNPGDAPADLGISERFRAQIRNSEASGRVIQNATNMMQSTDSWLQEAHNILDRMSELSVASADGSKSSADRVNLNLEFQELKKEIGRISESGKYNGLAVNSRTSVAVYDNLEHKLVYSQADGTNTRTLELDFRDGNSSDNSIKYAFESSANNGSVGDFVFTQDGKSLIYVAQKSVDTLSAQKTLMKLDLESNSITTLALTSAGGNSATSQARIVQDNKGRIWVSDPSTTATADDKQYNVKLLRQEAFTLDAGGVTSTNSWGGSVALASSFSEFAVHDDYIYYIERSTGTAPHRIVKRHVNNTTDKVILQSDISNNFGLNKGETYTISKDGQFLAFEDESSAGTFKVIHIPSGETATHTAGTRTNSVASLDFDSNNNLYWTDTGNTSDENAVKKINVSFGKGEDGSLDVVLGEEDSIRNGNAGHFGAFNSGMAARNMGLSVESGGPIGVYDFQIGPDAGMDIEFQMADISLVKLGISSLEVGTTEGAEKAIKALAKAIDKVANQRAIIGAQVSRIGFVHSANQGFQDNLAQAESRIRDVDMARETSELTKAQILSQASISMLSQANVAQQNILRLLQ